MRSTLIDQGPVHCQKLLRECARLFVRTIITTDAVSVLMEISHGSCHKILNRRYEDAVHCVSLYPIPE